MAPYGLKTIDYEHPFTRQEAPADVVAREIEIEATSEKPHTQPGQIAYALIEQLYNWFGLQSSTIPYASNEACEIDPTTF